MIGKRAEAAPTALRSIIEAGHELGNHSFLHDSYATMSKEEFLRDVEMTQTTIERIGGRPALSFRAPYGTHYPAISEPIAFRFGLPIIGWSSDDLDAPGPNTPEYLKKLLTSVQPGGILLAHESNPEILPFLEERLIAFQKAGYRFVTISELLGKK